MKLPGIIDNKPRVKQPPSGGCVLKRLGFLPPPIWAHAAAFGRLCVETLPLHHLLLSVRMQPPSGGCVLKHHGFVRITCDKIAAAFGRLCVETQVGSLSMF